MTSIEKFDNSKYTEHSVNLEKLESLIEKIENPILITGSNNNKTIVCQNESAYGVILPDGSSYVIGYRDDNYYFFDQEYRYDFVYTDKGYIVTKRAMDSFIDIGCEIIKPDENNNYRIRYKENDEEYFNEYEYNYIFENYRGAFEYYTKYLYLKYPSYIRIKSSRKSSNEYQLTDHAYKKIIFSLMGNGFVGNRTYLLVELKDEINTIGLNPIVDNDIISLMTNCNSTKISLDAGVQLYKTFLKR